MKYVLYTDGAARGNPGPAAIGVVLADEHGQVIDERGRTIGKTTNNEAEYRALIYGLEMAAQHGVDDLEIRTDSELLARQLSGLYKVRAPHLKSFYAQAQHALERFEHHTIAIIPRVLNRRADGLANQALDRSGSGSNKA